MSQYKSGFVSLHNHTEIGSPLDSINRVDELIKQVADLDQPGIAITDHGTMTALFDARKESKKRNVKIIAGMEAYFTSDLVEGKNNHLVLLAKSDIGYKNILRMNYESYRSQTKSYMGKMIPRISWEHLEKYNEDVVALTACSNGLIAKTLITEKDEGMAVNYIKRFQSIFADRFFLELQPHRLQHTDKNGKEVNQEKLNQTLIRLSHDMDIKYVITCDAHYRDADQAKYHDLMLAVKDKAPVDDPNRFRYGTQDMYLKSRDEIIAHFGAEVAEKGMRNSIDIFAGCQEPSFLDAGKTILPKFPVKDESNYSVFMQWKEENVKTELDEDKAYLRYLCVDSFKKFMKGRSNADKKLYWDRVKKELDVIEYRDFASYMLIVADYMRWARDNDVITGFGRGSAAGSLVAFLTGITKVDPIKHSLLFERFQNKEKKSLPDVDSDFSRPDLVKEYLRQKYGKDNVASISNWTTLSPKVIIKDVARSLKIGGDSKKTFEIANNITAVMPDVDSIEEAISISDKFAEQMHLYPELYKNACKLQNLTRNWSVHAAGVVISTVPLYEIIPVRMEDGNDMLISQWEKTRVEEFGLVKMDLLGLNTLEILNDAVQYVRASEMNKDFSIDNIPYDDQEVFNMIGAGETGGVFQLESTLTPLCIKIKPKTIDMIADINALGRPSCSEEEREKYIKGRHGIKPSYRHEKLESILAPTFGVSLYEEGMMFVAKECANWDLNKADSLRKITKLKGSDTEMVERTKRQFIADSVAFSGMTEAKAKEIWDFEIEPFGNYGFNRSHAVAYSYISYQTAFMRKHFPVQFMTSLLNNTPPNDSSHSQYIQESVAMGIRIAPPDINSSGVGYTIGGPDLILTGLGAIKGLGEKAKEEIDRTKPYSSLEDFFHRTNARVINKTVLANLIKAGCFDSFGRTRKDMFDNYLDYREAVQKFSAKNDETIDGLVLPVKTSEEWERKILIAAEQEVLGRTISGTLQEVFKGFFKNSSMVTKLKNLEYCNEGDKVRIEVIIKKKDKEFKIKKGKNIGKKFAKYEVEDMYQTVNYLTLWADDYEKYNHLFKDGTPIKAICKVGEWGGKKDISLQTLESVYRGQGNDSM